MSEESLPFTGILFRATHGFVHVSGPQKLSILLDSSFFFDLWICYKQRKSLRSYWIHTFLVSISTNLIAPFPFLLSGHRNTAHIKCTTEKVIWYKYIWQREKDFFFYSFFLVDLWTGSDRELSCGPLSPEQFMSSDDCTLSAAVCRMWGRQKHAVFLCPSKTIDFQWSTITPWKQNLWGSSLQQPTNFNLGQWPPCKWLFKMFRNKQAF